MNNENGAVAPKPQEEGRSRSKQKWLLPIIIVLVGLGGAVGLVASRPTPTRAPAERAVPVVSVIAPETHDAPLAIEGTGTVRPTAEITLSAQVGGRVVRVSPKLSEGSAFARGDVLMMVERASYENAVAIAEADVAQRRVELALAQQEQVIATEEFRLLNARRTGAAAADTTLGARLALRQPQLEAARAALARSEAQLSDAQLNLDRTIVRAPFAGRVRSESVDVGQFVSPGQVVADLYSTDEVEVAVSLSTRQAALIPDLWSLSPNQRIPATVRAEFGGVWHEWEGYVDRAAGALDETTRTVDAIVRVARPFDREGVPLLVGSYVRATIQGPTVSDLVALPRLALRDESTIWVVADQKLRTLPVAVTQEIQDTVFITANFAAGDQIVVSDLSVVTEGMDVTTTDDEPASDDATISDDSTASEGSS